MDSVQPPNPHGTPFLRVLALLVFALVIVVLSSLGTYWYVSNQMTQQFRQENSLNIVPTITPTFSPKSSGITCSSDKDCPSDMTCKDTPVCPTKANEPPLTVHCDSLIMRCVKDETANWKTYPTAKFFFKYPPTYVIKENVKDFFVVLANVNTPPSNAEISIDARLEGNYTNYETAITKAKESLKNPVVVNINNGVKISGVLGPGFGEGTQMTQALLKYGQGAIELETTGNDAVRLKLFEQLLSTFSVK